MTHTPGEWTDGKTPDSIVSQSNEGLIPFPKEERQYLYYYGGYPIAESVAPCNKALIKTAPELLETCIDALESLEDMDLQDSIAQGVVNVLVNRFRSVIAKAQRAEEARQ